MKVMFPVIPRALIITTACCSARRERERERDRKSAKGREKGREGERRKSEVTPFLWQEIHGHRCTIYITYVPGYHTMLPLWSSHHATVHTTLPLWSSHHATVHTTLPLWSSHHATAVMAGPLEHVGNKQVDRSCNKP